MRFYDYWRSSAAWRCRIAFNLKNVEPDHSIIDLTKDGGEQKQQDYLAMNPHALVPTLEENGQFLTQSMAIIEWLDELYPQPPLLPGNAWQRAEIRSFALAIACEIHPMQNLRVQNFLRDELNADGQQIQNWLHRWIGGGLVACDAVLAKQPATRTFAFGDQPTLADVFLAPQIYSARRFNVDVSGLPRILALEDNYLQHPAFINAHPDAQIKP